MKILNIFLVVFQLVLFVPLIFIPMAREDFVNMTSELGYKYLMNSQFLDYYSHIWVSVLIVVLTVFFLLKEFKIKSIKKRMVINFSFIILSCFILSNLFYAFQNPMIH
jgi:hypothetical protein